MQIIAHLKRVLNAEQTRQRYRVEETDFTRQRVLTFVRVAILMLRGHKLSLQTALNKFFGAVGAVFHVPTASAYCQARQKVQPELFVELNRITCADFYRLYGAPGEAATWRGHRLLGADGTTLNLPDTEELCQAFSVHRNQRQEFVQATVVVPL